MASRLSSRSLRSCTSSRMRSACTRWWRWLADRATKASTTRITTATSADARIRRCPNRSDLLDGQRALHVRVVLAVERVLAWLCWRREGLLPIGVDLGVELPGGLRRHRMLHPITVGDGDLRSG